MSEQTNKELLKAVLQQTKLNAENQLNFACKVSKFMNEQQLINAELRGYLETNNRTNQKGLVEQVKENTGDIMTLKTDKKIIVAKASTVTAIFMAIDAFLFKILGYLKITF